MWCSVFWRGERDALLPSGVDGWVLGRVRVGSSSLAQRLKQAENGRCKMETNNIVYCLFDRRRKEINLILVIQDWNSHSHPPKSLDLRNLAQLPNNSQPLFQEPKL